MEKLKYYKLYDKLKSEIISGVYTSKAKLPSKRTLADLWGVSIITVEKAYAMLEEEGYIFSAQRKGYFVCDFEKGSLLAKNNNIKSIELLKENKNNDSMGRDFEYSLWLKTVRKVLNDRSEELFIKSPYMGCEVLRNAISLYLLRYRKMFAEPSNIVIGSGAEQLYEIAIQIIGREKTVGIENPCYQKIKTVYDGQNIRYLPLKMGKDGIEQAELRRNDFDILHVTPFHSFPSGVSTSLTKRYKYLKWAEDKERFIIEDDYDSEFFLPGHPIETLYSLSHTDSVIYINTFSKSLSPSLRMGYMIIPDCLMEEYKKNYSELSCSVPVLDQYVLADFISSGNFERHLNRIRRKLKNGN